MKKFLLMAVVFIAAITTKAQSNNDKVYMYGIDFSDVKVYAANESEDAFSQAFQAINLLLVQEYEKYDFTTLLESNYIVEIEPIIKKLATSTYSEMKTLSLDLDPMDIDAMVQAYELKQESGIGAVIIAKLLHKPYALGYYELVMFDIETREILLQKEVIGKARGFGLRNYWAGSVYDVIKRTRM